MQQNQLLQELKLTVDKTTSRVESISQETSEKTQRLNSLATLEAGEQAVIDYYRKGLPNVSDTELIRLTQQILTGNLI